MSKYRVREMYGNGVCIDTHLISGRWVMVAIFCLLSYGCLDALGNGYPSLPLLPISIFLLLPIFFVRKRLSIYQLNSCFVVEMEKCILDIALTKADQYKILKNELVFNKGNVTGKLLKYYSSSIDDINGMPVVMLGDLKDGHADFVRRQLFEKF